MAEGPRMLVHLGLVEGRRAAQWRGIFEVAGGKVHGSTGIPGAMDVKQVGASLHPCIHGRPGQYIRQRELCQLIALLSLAEVAGSSRLGSLVIMYPVLRLGIVSSSTTII